MAELTTYASIKRTRVTNPDDKINMNQLRSDKQYFIKQFETGRIGVSYLFDPNQISWLETEIGPEWNKCFVNNVFTRSVEQVFRPTPNSRRLNLSDMD